MKVCWLSAGVSSFIAGYLVRDTVDRFIYIDIDDQHPDSMRFIKDCEKALGKQVEIIKSNYGSVENVCRCALPGFVDSKNEEKTERNAGYLVVSHSGGGMLRQGTRKGIRRTPANRGMRAHRIVKSLDISEDVCHGLCP